MDFLRKKLTATPVNFSNHNHTLLQTMAQSDNVQWHVGHPEWAAPRHGMRAHIKHRIELVRHGETDCNIGLTTEGKVHPTPDPPLTARGRKQAADIGRFYSQMIDISRPTGGWAPEDEPYTRFEVSPLQRTLDTAAHTLKIFAGLPGEKELDVSLRERWRHDGVWVPNRELDLHGQYHTTGNHWWCPQESYGEFQRRVYAKVEEWMTHGSAEDRCHTIVFGHSLFINNVLTHFIPTPISDDEEAPVFFHLPNGSITVIDIDTENKMHIHCVGYTQHLTETSGQHTAHVAYQSVLRPPLSASEKNPLLRPF